MRRRGITALVMALALALPAAGTAQNPPRVPPQEAVVAEARLAPGDIVRITVWRKPEFSGEFTIDENGAPRHPLYKQVPVVGISLGEAEKRLVQFLTGYEQNPQVVVEPLFRVTVGGEVMNPSLFSLARETTILQAIALAGGPTERGRLNKVRITRGKVEVAVDLTRVNSEWAHRRINSGDQILVTRKRNYLTEVIGPFAAIVGALAAVLSIYTSAAARSVE